MRAYNFIWREMLLTMLSALAAGILGSLFLMVLILLASGSAQAAAVDGEVRRGTLLLTTATGEAIEDAPLLDTDVILKVSGMLARVSVSQTFTNPGADWVEGVYVFPLPENAAVDRLRLRIGERIIEGEIQERRQAEQTYQQAKREGRKASLLSQQRPNIFTTAVANIAPGETIVVELEYQQDVPFDQGTFRLRFPMVVGPRYIPGQALGVNDEQPIQGFSATGWSQDTDQVPDASLITPPVLADGQEARNPVRLRVELDAGFDLARLESSYHDIDRKDLAAGRYEIKIKGPVPADRDFELVWSPRAADAPQGALFIQQWKEDRYALLMLMPPLAPTSAEPVPRELVFVIDTSGSMFGESIEQAKAALQMALRRLRPRDRFNLIQFDSITRALYAQAVPADAANVNRALAYVASLQADGGTEMLPAIEQALKTNPETGGIRQVVFLTDGSVGNEAELFRVIGERLGDSRLFTIGIGSAPNSYFMSRAAAMGRGSFTYIGNTDEVREKMTGLFAKLESPALTDITVHWPNDAKVEMWPQRVPDLYLGEPLVLAVRSTLLPDEVKVSGTIGNTAWDQTVTLRGGGDNTGVHAVWARRKIDELMSGTSRGQSDEQVRAEVLPVALEHQLVSKYTSLVAVDRTPVRPTDEPLKTKPVSTNLPAGWSAEHVFGSLPQTATSAELKLILGIVLLLLGILLMSRQPSRHT